MYIVICIGNHHFKVEDNEFISFLRKLPLKDQKCIMSDVRDYDTKVPLYGCQFVCFKFPTNLD